MAYRGSDQYSPRVARSAFRRCHQAPDGLLGTLATGITVSHQREADRAQDQDACIWEFEALIGQQGHNIAPTFWTDEPTGPILTGRGKCRYTTAFPAAGHPPRGVS
jgi:hypothetical protein